MDVQRISLGKSEILMSSLNIRTVEECVRKCVRILEEAPSAPYVRYLVKKVKETGIFIDKPMCDEPKTVRTPEIIAAVAESMCEA